MACSVYNIVWFSCLFFVFFSSSFSFRKNEAILGLGPETLLSTGLLTLSFEFSNSLFYNDFAKSLFFFLYLLQLHCWCRYRELRWIFRSGAWREWRARKTPNTSWSRVWSPVRASAFWMQRRWLRGTGWRHNTHVCEWNTSD